MSLMAIMIGRLEMNIDECIAVYGDLVTAIFDRINLQDNGQLQFNMEGLQTIIQNLIEKSGASRDALLNDGWERRCKTYVFS